MKEEYNSLLENQTWDMVPLPSGRNLFKCKWVYRTKREMDKQVNIYKSRLVSKGFQQVHDIDYDETFAPVANMDSIGWELSIMAEKGWEFNQMDMKNAFLHDDIFKEIYMEQPQGFMEDSSLVCRLKKSHYGLKEASTTWYSKIDSYLLSQNLVHCKSDLNVYMLRMDDSLLILLMYVDDLLIIGFSTSSIVVVKRILHDRFLMMDMGLLRFLPWS
jgi:hypothetical protein